MYPRNRRDVNGIFIKNIQHNLSDQGIAVSKIVIKGRQTKFFRRIYQYIVFYFEILLCDFRKYDIIHVSYPSHSYMPLLFKMGYKEKLVVRLHGHDLLSVTRLGFFLKIFTKIAVSHSVLTVVPSTFFYEKLKRFHEPSDYFIYPSGGINLKLFNTPSKASYKPYLSLGYVGRIVKDKGIDILLKALRTLDFDYHLIIIGDKNQDKEHYNLLIRYIEENNLQNYVSFSNFVDQKKLPAYYAEMDVFIFPTLYEASFGNVAIEAMACNLPVICSRIGALQNYIVDKHNGYFFNPGDSDDLAAKVTAYYELSNDRKIQLSKNARKTAQEYDQKYLNELYVSKLYDKFAL